MGTRLYVGNLDPFCTESSLHEIFSAEGRSVAGIVVAKHRRTGESRGFGFVEMASEEDANAAADALDRAELDGRRLRVRLAREAPAGFAATRRD